MGGLFKAGGLHSKLVDPLKIIPEGTFMDSLPGHKRTADKKVEVPTATAPKTSAPNAGRVALRRQTSLGGPATAPSGTGLNV